MTSAVDRAAVHLVRAAVRSQVTIGAAESLTGGALASAIVGVPGASACFVGAIVSYSHQSKEHLLGVPGDVLKQQGAVDPDVARAMALGAREALDCQWAIATTGVAGPEPHEGRSVGTVFVGLSGPAGEDHIQLNTPGDRGEIRRYTVIQALDMLASHIRLTANSQ